MNSFNLIKTAHLKNAVYICPLGEGVNSFIKLYQCKSNCKENNENNYNAVFVDNMDIEVADIRDDDQYVIMKDIIPISTKCCNTYFVVKELKKKHIDTKKDKDLFLHEYSISYGLDHINIRKTLDFDIDKYAIIFENCKGIDLLDYANSYRSYNTKSLVSYFSQLLDAVCYIHGKGIAHMDIKLENIVLDIHTNSIKLIDFGESVLFANDTLFKQQRGTVQYMPPEVIEPVHFYNAPQADLWCCGIVLYNLYYNKMPWKFSKKYSCVNYYKHYHEFTKHNRLNAFLFKDNKYYTDTENKIMKSLFKILLNPIPQNRKNAVMAKTIFNLAKLN